MICTRVEDGWEVIYQRAHALLAAELVAPWQAPAQPERWTELLTATAQHDNGWQEWEAARRLTPLGTPLHFRETPVEDLVAQSERAVRRAWHQSLWTGLLVSTHVDHLYAGMEAPELKTLLDAQRALRAKWRRALGVTQQAVDADYEYLLFGDTFSLVLCLGDLPFGERRIEIETVGGTRYWAWQRADETVGVDPWPYGRDAFEVGVDVYRLRQLTFANEAALADALADARPERRRWTLTKRGG